MKSIINTFATEEGWISNFRVVAGKENGREEIFWKARKDYSSTVMGTHIHSDSALMTLYTVIQLVLNGTGTYSLEEMTKRRTG